MKEYQKLSDEISELFYQSLEIEKELRSNSEDCHWINNGYYSESAMLKAHQWFNNGRIDLITSSGWTVDEYDKAEREEAERFYQSLEIAKEMVDGSQSIFIHMDDDCEPEID